MESYIDKDGRDPFSEEVERVVSEGEIPEHDMPVDSEGNREQIASQGVPPADQGVPPVSQGVPPVSQGVPHMRQNVTQVCQDVPPADQGVPPVSQSVPPVCQNVPKPGSDSKPSDSSVDGIPLISDRRSNSENESNRENGETPEPAFLDDSSGHTLPPPCNFKAANEKIASILAEKTSPVRAGPQYSLVREFPSWKSATDLRAAASRPINWAVKNLWTERAKILLAAEQKAGKSWIVCHVAMCYAAGLAVFGHDRFAMMEPGPVGIVAGEDDESEIGRRLDRMFRAQGLLMSDYPVHFVSGHNLRMNRERDQDFIRRGVQDMGLKLVIYDPLARLMDGDENSKEIVSAVLNPASSLAIEEGVSVMVVHHLGKQSTDVPRTAIARVRGSSDITSWFSCGMFLSGNMRLGRLNLEVLQRTSGDVPNEFPINVKEDQDSSVYGLGTLRFLADLRQDDPQASGRNEVVIEEAARAIFELVQGKGDAGVTRAEISVHLGYGSNLMNAALKKLIREERTVFFQAVEDLPEKNVILARQAAGAGNVVPLPSNYQADSSQTDFEYPDPQLFFPEEENE